MYTYTVKNPAEWSAAPAFQRHQRHNFLSNDEVRDKSRIDSHEETVWSTALPHVKMTSMDFINIRNDSTRKYYTCRILVPLSNCYPEIMPPHFNLLTNTKIFSLHTYLGIYWNRIMYYQKTWFEWLHFAFFGNKCYVLHHKKGIIINDLLMEKTSFYMFFVRY